MDTPLISLEKVGIYQGDRKILNEVDLTLMPGDFVYLIGETGSGKSSLLKTLYADIPLHEGTGIVCGHNLKGITDQAIPLLRRKLGIVFQDFQFLYDRTVEENLRFVLEATGWKKSAEIKARIQAVLEQVGLKDKGPKMPHQLSGGEQQRVIIARALLNDPPVILADEPTGNLDPGTSEEITLLLKELVKSSNRALLMATHDYSIILKFPARTLKCKDGVVFEAIQRSI